jgi:hypothetical protein
MNNSTQILPDRYFQSAEINLKKDKRLTILLNIGAFIVFIPMFYLLTGFIALVRPEVKNFSESITIGKMLGALGLTVIVLIIHEIIHGLFFWIFSRGRPVFALRPLYAYAGAPT